VAGDVLSGDPVTAGDSENAASASAPIATEDQPASVAPTAASDGDESHHERRMRVLQRVITPLDGHRGDSRALYSNGLMFDIDRRSMIIPEHHVVSFGSYFNAFPASYWRRWTDLRSIRLRIKARGAGKITIFRSTSSGLSWSEQHVVLPGGGESTEVAIDLSLEPFIDGGWYWFDVLAFAGGDVIIEEAEWLGATDRLERGRVSVGITTFNRAEFCVDQIRNLGNHPDLLEVLDRVYVVDQGSQRVQDHPGFEAAAANLGDKLVVIEQGNLGGSGGFARAMYEAVEAGSSDYLLLLDDDVITEPEGIIRAATFADLARQPIVVGGHMFSIFVRSVLHAYGEAIAKYRWFWGAAPHSHHGHDFGPHPLVATPWLHRRIDVDYNGWWMCLLPVDLIRKVGLALPMFIKWDDADYGLRAGENGFPTVSMPGVAVWHVPWHEKDDTVDWQAYFHERNRLLSALLHSPYPHGGSLLRESYTQTIKHILAMQYSPARMILMAIEDLLEGPEHMHRDIHSKIAELRAMRQDFDDAKFCTDLREFPSIHGRRPGRPRRKEPDVSTKRGAFLAMMKVMPRQLKRVPREARQHPQGSLPRVDQQWWRIAEFDSVLVSSADGSSAAWYRRSRRQFKDLMLRAITLHTQMLRRWDELSKLYRDAVPHLASTEEWRKTFEISERSATPSARAARLASMSPVNAGSLNGSSARRDTRSATALVPEELTAGELAAGELTAGELLPDDPSADRIDEPSEVRAPRDG
jgi:galactofuranosylgalactofuranosylrhamnosyl-N-acetylglucosaminyl-diphospho-decaprenol beta-1,5/1,6-galactofuranosyltransferase